MFVARVGRVGNLLDGGRDACFVVHRNDWFADDDYDQGLGLVQSDAEPQACARHRLEVVPSVSADIDWDRDWCDVASLD